MIYPRAPEIIEKTSPMTFTFYIFLPSWNACRVYRAEKHRVLTPFDTVSNMQYLSTEIRTSGKKHEVFSSNTVYTRMLKQSCFLISSFTRMDHSKITKRSRSTNKTIPGRVKLSFPLITNDHKFAQPIQHVRLYYATNWLKENATQIDKSQNKPLLARFYGLTYRWGETFLIWT